MLPPAKFCKHGLGIDFTCPECGVRRRKGVHVVAWDAEQQAYVYPPPENSHGEEPKAKTPR